MWAFCSGRENCFKAFCCASNVCGIRKKITKHFNYSVSLENKMHYQRTPSFCLLIISTLGNGEEEPPGGQVDSSSLTDFQKHMVRRSLAWTLSFKIETVPYPQVWYILNSFCALGYSQHGINLIWCFKRLTSKWPKGRWEKLTLW